MAPIHGSPGTAEKGFFREWTRGFRERVVCATDAGTLALPGRFRASETFII